MSVDGLAEMGNCNIVSNPLLLTHPPMAATTKVISPALGLAVVVTSVGQ